MQPKNLCLPPHQEASNPHHPPAHHDNLPPLPLPASKRPPPDLGINCSQPQGHLGTTYNTPMPPTPPPPLLLVTRLTRHYCLSRIPCWLSWPNWRPWKGPQCPPLLHAHQTAVKIHNLPKMSHTQTPACPWLQGPGLPQEPAGQFSHYLQPHLVPLLPQWVGKTTPTQEGTKTSKWSNTAEKKVALALET